MSEIKVGGEVDSFCTKCKMMLAHTVLAIWAGDIKRVRCNTCMGEHAYRRSEPGATAPKAASKPRAASSSASKPSSAARAEAAAAAGYDELLANKDRATARRYDLKEKFAVGDLVQHPSFGLGVVAASRGLDKIDVAFPGSVKTLMHNKGAGPATFAKPPPKRAEEPEAAEAAPAEPAAAEEETDEPPDEDAAS